MANLTARFQMIDDMSSKLDAVGRSGEDMVDRLEEIGDAAETAFDNVKSGSVHAAQSIDGVATAATSAGQQGTQMGTEIADAAQKAAEETEKLGEETEGVGEQSEETGEKGQAAIEALANALQSAGIAMMLQEIVEWFGECSDAAAQVETVAAKVSTIADSTQMSLAKINQSTMALSNDTGQAATALLDSVYNSISAGVQTAHAVEFVDEANKLAVGGFTSATTAVDVLTTALNAYGLSVEQVSQVSDYLITTQNLGKTTVDELANSVGKVIPLAAAYGVQMDNLSTAYAIMTANGIATAESGTYLKSILSELGDSGSQVSKILVDQTGSSFAELTAQGYSLGDILDVLGDSVNGDATAFANLWASTEAGIGALSLFNSGAERYNQVLGEMSNSAGATEKAYATMAATTETAHNRMSNAANNLEVAIGSALNPTLAKLYNGIANVTGAAAEFVAEHPAVAKAVTALAVGLGTATAAVLGFMAIKTAIPLIKAFGVALNGALGPIGWVAIGITAVVSAGAALIAMMDDAQDETLEMTSTTRAQYAELQELEAAYQDACDTYGETSAEASRLRYQLDDLSASFEANRQTIEEFAAECQSVVDAHTDMVNRFEENNAKIDDNEVSTYALIQKLSDLADGTYETADSQAAMQAIIDELNGSIEGLNLSYSDVISNQDDVIQGVKEMAQAEAERARQQEMYDEYVELIKQQAVEQEQLAKATDEAAAAQDRFRQANAEWESDLSKWGDIGPMAALFTGSAAAWDAAKENLDTANGAVENLESSLADTEARILEIETAWGLHADAVGESEDATISWEDASKQAFAAVQTEMEELIQAYQDVYNEALTSFEGQFGLFEQATTESDEYLNATVENAQAALDSQLAYWESYAANIETLQGVTAEQLNITQEQYAALMSYVQDGSAEAAGLAQSMVDNINSGNEEAVTELATTMADVAAKRQEVASSTAEWVTDFSSKMDELTAKMEETVEGLNLDGEAAAAAKATIQAYADSILASKASAVSAANQVSAAVEAALAATNARINVTVSGGTPGHAEGTTYSEDVFIAGEEGPELIVGHEGSTVFPTTETDRIVNAVNGMDGVTSVTFAEELVTALARYSAYRDNSSGTILAPPERVQETTSDSRTTQAQDKTIRLEIAGSGAVNVGAGTSKEEVVELLYANLKPVLMSIVQEEVFEEGDNSYDF